MDLAPVANSQPECPYREGSAPLLFPTVPNRSQFVCPDYIRRAPPCATFLFFFQVRHAANAMVQRAQIPLGIHNPRERRGIFAHHLNPRSAVVFATVRLRKSAGTSKKLECASNAVSRVPKRVRRPDMYHRLRVDARNTAGSGGRCVTSKRWRQKLGRVVPFRLARTWWQDEDSPPGPAIGIKRGRWVAVPCTGADRTAGVAHLAVPAVEVAIQRRKPESV